MSTSTLDVPIRSLELARQEQEVLFAQFEREKQARSITTLVTEPEDYDGISMSQSEASLGMLPLTATEQAGPSMLAQTRLSQSFSQVDHIMRQQEEILSKCRQQHTQAPAPAPLSPGRKPSYNLPTSSYDDFPTIYDDKVAYSSSTEHQGNLTLRDFDIDEQALADALAASSSDQNMIPPPSAAAGDIELATTNNNNNNNNEVDVDDIIVRKVKKSSAKVGRNTNTRTDSFEEHIVGAWDIQNAGDAPTAHPSDTQPPPTTQHQSARFRTRPQPQEPLQRSASAPACRVQVPPTLIRHQQYAESSQSEITQSMSLSTNTPRNNNNYSNSSRNNMPVANLVLEEPDAPPFPATLVASGTNVQITGPPDDSDIEEGGTPPPTEQKTTLAYVLGGGACVGLMLLVVALLCLFVEGFDFLGLYQEKDSDHPSNPNNNSLPMTAIVPTQPPTLAPTAAPTSYVLDLPNATMAVIRADPASAQARAYRWSIIDTQLHPERTIERQLQRFALATLYFATNRPGSGPSGNSGEVENSRGDAWKRSGGWLHHDIDECQWETSASTGRDLPTPYVVCDPRTGLYESLDLYDNGLRGHVPPELSLLTTLKILDLGRGDLQYCDRCIPSELGLLNNLEHFNFFFSYAKGPVPSELGQWTNLKVLSIERNRFLGTIPTQLGRLTNLQQFNFERNQLIGTLPAELGIPLAIGLWELNVENNYLTGTIPQSYNEAMEVRKRRHGEGVQSDGKLLNVRFRGNMFTGTVPEEMCSLQRQLDFDCESTGNPEEGLCGCTCECAAAMPEETGSISIINPDNNDFV